MIPEKLYGREDEIATLLAAFDRVVKHGGSELVLVSVTRHRQVVGRQRAAQGHRAARGIFISGKFDQRLRDTPMRPWLRRFRD